jgi:tetrapyrrole methylase family protein/MazG family protein
VVNCYRGGNLEKEGKFTRLIELMATLRGHGGCPWDREQTHQSIRPYLLEETYEVLEAIDSGDDEKFREELGDLLLQIVFHSQMAKEEGKFDIYEVIDGIVKKLIRRHPHVFGQVKVKTSQEVLENWEKIKGGEREGTILDGVPKSLPALLKAFRVQEKLSRVEINRSKTEEIYGEIEDRLSRLREATQKGDAELKEKRLGDLLFSLVSLARNLGFSPEDALRRKVEEYMAKIKKP